MRLLPPNQNRGRMTLACNQMKERSNESSGNQQIVILAQMVSYPNVDPASRTVLDSLLSYRGLKIVLYFLFSSLSITQWFSLYPSIPHSAHVTM